MPRDREPVTQPQQLTASARELLERTVRRVEKVNEEAKAVSDDRKAIFAEAKAAGFDTKAIRAVVKVRAADRQKLEAEEQIKDLYLHALGELDEAPGPAR